MEALNSLIESVDTWEGIFILDKGADTKTKIFNNFNHPRILKHKCRDHKGAEQARHEAIKLHQQIGISNLIVMIRFLQML